MANDYSDNVRTIFSWRNLRMPFLFTTLGLCLLTPLLYSFIDGQQRFFCGSVFTAFLLLLSAIDFKWSLLPDALLLPMGIIGLAFDVSGWLVPPLAASAAAALAFAGMLAVRIFSGGGLGGGDVKLSGVLGLWLGYDGVSFALLVAFISGGVIAVLWLLSGRGSRHDQLPFGPFLSFGAIVSFMGGAKVWYLYWSWL